MPIVLPQDGLVSKRAFIFYYVFYTGFFSSSLHFSLDKTVVHFTLGNKLVVYYTWCIIYFLLVEIGVVLYFIFLQAAQQHGQMLL